jgi:hypothetical protein
MSGLARVSSANQNTGREDKFVFMRGDACHYSGETKPTEYLPLPKTIGPSPVKGTVACPGTRCPLIQPEGDPTKPFHKLFEPGPHHVVLVAEQTLRHVKEFDAADNVFVIWAHDAALLEPGSGINFFPQGTLNGWRAEDLAARLRWTFLKDFEESAEKLEDLE